MSLSNIRDFLRDRMTKLGFKEHTDGFNFENITSTIIDETFHIDSGDFSSVSLDQQSAEFDWPQTIRVFLKGFQDPASTIDKGFDIGNEIINDFLNSDNRFGDDYANIEPSALSVVQFSDNNDNLIIIIVDFNVKVFLDFR